MAKRKLVPWRRLLNLVALLGCVAAIVFVLVARTGSDGEAYAAPRVAKPVADAGTDAAPLAATLSVPGADAGAKDEAKSEEPIDLATAPDGGVPAPAAGTSRFKSPFAKPNAGPPVRIKVGMLLNTVDDYDVKTGTFTADFFLSLTSVTPMPSLNLQFPNGKLDNKEEIADKPTFKLYRLTGSFKSAADLRKYPFDSQELRIIVEDDARGIDQIRFVADKERTQLARGFRAVGWQVSFVEAKAQSMMYPDRFENDDLLYSRYTFALGLDRFATSAAFKVFVPAFVIVIISLLGMWIPAEEMEVRSNSGAPMLAGAVLFHFALIQELPATSYMTRADKLMLAVYVSLALGMLSTWWMFLVKEHNIPKVFKIARVLVPMLSVITMALGVLV